MGLRDLRASGLLLLRLLRLSGLGERRLGASFVREGGGEDEYRFLTRRGGERDREEELESDESDLESESESDEGDGLSCQPLPYLRHVWHSPPLPALLTLLDLLPLPLLPLLILHA